MQIRASHAMRRLMRVSVWPQPRLRGRRLVALGTNQDRKAPALHRLVQFTGLHHTHENFQMETKTKVEPQMDWRGDSGSFVYYRNPALFVLDQ